MSPEQLLWLKVLIRAGLDLLETEPGFLQGSRRSAARRWIESEATSFCGFIWVCDSLALDSATLRRRLLRRADRENGRTSAKGQGESVDTGATAREVFGDFTYENRKAAVGPPSP